MLAWSWRSVQRGGANHTATAAENAAPTADNAVMLTVFLKDDQSRPLSELTRSFSARAITRLSRRKASKS